MKTATFVALVFDALPDINWLRIYVLRDIELVLGPFQDKPACVRIPMGQGICGSAAEQITIIVRCSTCMNSTDTLFVILHPARIFHRVSCILRALRAAQRQSLFDTRDIFSRACIDFDHLALFHK